MVKTESLSRRIARRLVFGLDGCGLLRLYTRLLPQSGTIILMYHSVASEDHAAWIDPANHLLPETFEQQIQFLATQRTVISLKELTECLRDGKSCPPRSVVITFDDGYLDNLTVAAPILARHGLPATLFLPTGQIDRGEIQWIDDVYSCFRYRTCDQLSELGMVTGTYHLGSTKQRDAAYRALCAVLLRSDYVAREQLLGTLRERLKPSQRPPRLTMTWDDVGELGTRHPAFEIGGHTVNHTDTSQLTAEEAFHELTACRERIQQMTGVVPIHFSYPYGRMSPTIRKAVAEVGFESACGGVQDPLICKGADPFALRRIAAPRSIKHFGFLTSFLNSGVLHRVAR